MDRKTDAETRTRFRSDRFFVSQGQWFCNTRDEPAPLGPFTDRARAEAALYRFLVDQGIDLADDPWGRPGATH
jgi:hypothetical protein